MTGGSEVRLIRLSDLKRSILDLDRIIVLSGSGFYLKETWQSRAMRSRGLHLDQSRPGAKLSCRVQDFYTTHERQAHNWTFVSAKLLVDEPNPAIRTTATELRTNCSEISVFWYEQPDASLTTCYPSRVTTAQAKKRNSLCTPR